jgi:hypothetical protein
MGNTLAIMLICLAGWAYLFPEDARAIIQAIKGRIWLRLLRRWKSYGAKELAQSLHDRATQKGIETSLVDQFLVEHHDYIVYSLEVIYAGRLGDPDDPVSWS